MAHVWIPANEALEASNADWVVAVLEEEIYRLTGDVHRPIASGQQDGARAPAYILRHDGGPDGERWVLYSSPRGGVRVNATRLGLGMRLLRDRDEVRLGRSRLIFSTERLARVEPFPGLGREVLCPRCKLPIDVGTPAVQCPNARCGLWFHQDVEHDLPCWTYAPTCASCEQPTSLEAGFAWTPAHL
jgi:hypothetical protein